MFGGHLMPGKTNTISEIQKDVICKTEHQHHQNISKEQITGIYLPRNILKAQIDVFRVHSDDHYSCRNNVFKKTSINEQYLLYFQFKSHNKTDEQHRYVTL